MCVVRNLATKQTVSLDESRVIISQKNMNLIDKICAHDADESKRKLKTPCLGHVIAPGGGKSHINSQTAIYAYRKNKPSVILTPTNDLVSEAVQLGKKLLAKKLKAEGLTKREIKEHISEVVGYHGRQGVDEKKYGSDLTKYGRKYACFRMKSVESAGENNHPIGPNLCRNCPNGRLGEIMHGDPARAWEHEKWFKDNEFDKKNYQGKDCQFLRIAMKDQLAAKLLVAPSDAYAETIENWTNDKEKIERLMIVDETIALNRRVKIVQGDVKNIKASIDKALIKMIDDNVKKAVEQEKIKFALENNYTNKNLAHIDLTSMKEELLHSIDQLNLRIQHVKFYESLSQTLWQITAEMGCERLSDELKKRVLDVHVALKKFDLMTGGTLRFERITYTAKTIENEFLDEFYVPLRFFNDFAIAVRNNTVTIRNQSYIIYTETQIFTKAKDKGGVIFTDATMPSELKTLIEHTGGEVVQLDVPQNIKVTRIGAYFYARGKPDSRSYRYKCEAQLKDMISFAKDMKKRSNPKIAMLTHKAFFKNLAKDDGFSNGDPFLMRQKLSFKTGAELGWFGRHDRGHNDWIHHNICFFSHAVLSNERGAISDGYNAARAVMLACGDTSWGEWSGVMEKVDQGAPMPVDALDANGNLSRAKAWYLQFLGANLIQAIGRSRAVSSASEIQCWLLGGIDTKEVDDELARYGITIAERVDNPHHIDKDGYERRGISDPQIDAVCLDMQKRGKAISANKVIDEIILMLDIGVADFDCGATKGKILDRLKLLRANGLIPPEPKPGRPPAKPARAPEPVPAMPEPETPALPIKTDDAWQKEFLEEERALYASVVARQQIYVARPEIHLLPDANNEFSMLPAFMQMKKPVWQQSGNGQLRQ